MEKTEGKTIANPPALRAKPKSKGLGKFEKLLAWELRMLMADKNLRLKQVCGAMEEQGIRESERGLSAKIAKGTFSAAYYLAIKEAIAKL